MNALLLGLGSVLASAAGQLLLASGARAPGASGWGALLLSPRVIAGLVCWTASTLLWLAALQRERLSLVYALASLNYVLVPLGARVFLGERLGGTRVLGRAVIALGVGICLAGRGAGEPAP